MWVKYEGINFNKDWVASKSLKEFSEHEKHHNLSEKQYKEVWLLCGGKEKIKESQKPIED